MDAAKKYHSLGDLIWMALVVSLFVLGIDRSRQNDRHHDRDLARCAPQTASGIWFLPDETASDGPDWSHDYRTADLILWGLVLGFVAGHRVRTMAGEVDAEGKVDAEAETMFLRTLDRPVSWRDLNVWVGLLILLVVLLPLLWALWLLLNQ